MISNLAGRMRGLLVGLVVSALTLAGVAPAQAAERVTVLHVFLAAGQSNMSGRGLPRGSTDDPADPRIFQYGAKERRFRTATVPLDMHDTASGISPATTFAREYLKTQPGNVGVLVIPAAHGGTGFTGAASSLTWSAGAALSSALDLPELAVRQTKEGIAAAKATGRAVDLKGILWHQGENNSSMTTASYSAHLDKLIAFFRSRLVASKLPFVVGQMAPEGIEATPGRANIDRSHRETPTRVAHTGFAPSKSGAVNSGDTIHFNRTGVQYLGKTYLSAYWHAANVTHGPVPTVTGTRKVGSTLSAVSGTWGPAPVSLAYRWYRSGAAISDATGAGYKLRSGDAGRSITVKVTGTKAGYSTASRTSAGTSAIAKATLTAPAPTVTGTAAAGSTLVAVPGHWGPIPVTLTYKWYRSHILISDARSATYKVRTGDRGRTLTVTVTGSKAGYTTTSKTSSGTKVAG